MLAPVPVEHIAWRDPRLRGAAVVIVLAAVVGAATLPRALVSADEFADEGKDVLGDAGAAALDHGGGKSDFHAAAGMRARAVETSGATSK